MKLNESNIKEYAQNVMSKRDLAGYNKLNGTSYETVSELLDGETTQAVLDFYEPALRAGK